MGNIQFFTGFEGCGCSDDARSFFDFDTAGGVAYHADQGLEGGKCAGLYAAGLGGAYVWATKNLVTATKTIVVGFHIKNVYAYDPSVVDGRYIVKFNGPDVKIFNSSGGFRLVRSGSVISSAGLHAWLNTALHHVEIKFFSSATAGTIDVKVDGLLVWSDSGLNTGGQDIASITFGPASDTYKSCYYDNIFISDDWEGELASYLIKPESDDSVQWTPSTGADNYAMVDDDAQDGDSTYVETTTAGHKDIYEFEDVPGTVTTINAVSLVLVAKKVDPSGLTQVQMLSVQDSTERNAGDVVTLTNAYPSVPLDAKYRILTTCPDGTAWTPAKLNAIKWGFEAVA